MKRKVLFAGTLFLALGVTMLLSQQGQQAFSQCWGKFPAFIPISAVTPRGVAVDKVGNVYVSVGEVRGDGEHILIWKFKPSGRGPSLFAEIGQGTIGGLVVGADGHLYVALAAGVDRGVWRVDRMGHIGLLPGSDQIFFANGLAFDNRGTLYITESVSMDSPPAPGPGGIWRIPRRGQAELCLRDGLLTGTGVLGNIVPIGANGIAYYHGNLYVTNTEQGTVVRIRVWPDGSVGLPELWTTLQEVPESPLAGAPHPVAGDGVALDVHGNLYVAVLTRSAVVRLNLLDKSQETVAAFCVPDTLPLYAPIDFPASLVFGTGKGERTNLFVTNMGLGAVRVPGLPWSGPGLVKIHAGAPGRPLH